MSSENSLRCTIAQLDLSIMYASCLSQRYGAHKSRPRPLWEACAVWAQDWLGGGSGNEASQILQSKPWWVITGDSSSNSQQQVQPLFVNLPCNPYRHEQFISSCMINLDHKCLHEALYFSIEGELQSYHQLECMQGYWVCTLHFRFQFLAHNMSLFQLV